MKTAKYIRKVKRAKYDKANDKQNKNNERF